MIMEILCVLFGHYLADYPLQSDFLASTKGTSRYSLFVHCFLYAMTMTIVIFLVLSKFLFGVFLVFFISHVIIDTLKATAKDKQKALTTYLAYDQLAHIFIAGVVYGFLKTI